MTRSSVTAPTDERADLLDALAKARFFLRFTARDLTDGQAATRSTVSALTVGGIIKHVSHVEAAWIRFAKGDREAVGNRTEGHGNSFVMFRGETLEELLRRYDEIAADTDEFVRSAPDLGISWPLPEAPWFPPGARWSIRRVITHVIAETAQHSGHADIVREAIDGATTMA